MLSQDLLKKLGVLGVSVGLMASPLTFAGMHEEPADPAAPPVTDPVNDPTAPDPATQPADPATQSTDPAVDPATDPTSDPMADPGAPASGSPADEPGFGGGTEPMPSGEDAAQPGAAQPSGEDEWEMPED